MREILNVAANSNVFTPRGDRIAKAACERQLQTLRNVEKTLQLVFYDGCTEHAHYMKSDVQRLVHMFSIMQPRLIIPSTSPFDAGARFFVS